MTGQLTFAFVAGTVATANPCGFALLPAYLARQLGAEDSLRRHGAVARALVVGALTTVGFLLVFGSMGTGISLGARWLTRVIPWAALAIGAALVLAGLAVLAGKRIGVRLPTPLMRSAGDGYGSVLLFGVGYGVASLSCTLPIFLAVVGTAITGSALTGALTFAAYAAGMGTILTALAVAAALSRTGLAGGIRRLLPYITRLTGALLFAAGGYIVYYWAIALVAPGSGGSGVIEAANRLSADFQGWLSSATGQTVSAVLAGAIAVLIVWAFWPRTSRAFVRRRKETSEAAPSRAAPARDQAEGTLSPTKTPLLPTFRK